MSSAPMRRTTFGIHGPIGHGKSSVADRLSRKYGFIRGSFAGLPGDVEGLKEICCTVFCPLGAERRHFFGTQADKNEPIPALGGTTGRKILVSVGTKGFRAAYQDVWVRIGLEVSYANYRRVVFEDVRYPNEVDALRAVGGKIISVRALGKEIPEPEEDDESEQHWRTMVYDHAIHVPVGAMARLNLEVDLIVRATRESQAS